MNSNSKLENGIYYLFDKYLKSNDNYLPLKAYLQFIESSGDNLDGFSVISTNKPTNSTSSPQMSYADAAKVTNVTSTLNIIKKPNAIDESTSQVILAQKLYKIIITVDYSPQTTSLDFIKKGLEVIFEKISHEYDEFYQNCYNTEPQIYVTVLLWNSSTSNVFTHNSVNTLPFLTILHSKRLLKSNLNEIGLFIFNKINEAKHIILETLKNQKNKDQLRINTNEEELHPNGHSKHGQKTKSSFEEFLRIIVKIFGYFCINEIGSTTMSSAPTSLACSHHIHLTEGLIHATDMVKCLDKISKSSITFSFIYSGTSAHLSGSNISSSFGHLADYSLMKLIAFITNGFYSYLDENLDLTQSINKRMFYSYKLSPASGSNNSRLNLVEEEINKSINLDSEYDEESRDTFCQKSANTKSLDRINFKSQLNRSNSKKCLINSKGNKSSDLKELQLLFQPDCTINDLQFELKLIKSYELSQKKLNILQISRIRAQEGFFLSNITRKLIKSKNSSPQQASSPSKSAKSSFYLISLYFKKYFTQTITLIYKVSYFVQYSGQRLAVSENESSSLEVSVPGKGNQKLLVELWISWNLLHLKAKYQNLELLDRVKQFLSHLTTSDSKPTFELTSDMLDPPEILKLKEPLYKLSTENPSIEDHHDQLKPSLSLLNINIELNIRTNKNSEKDLFNEFAHAWDYLRFLLNKNALSRYFGTHSIKLLLDYDRPLPEINTCIFDNKNRIYLSHFEMISEPLSMSPLSAPENHSHRNHPHHHLPNLSSAIRSNFNCQSSMNKLKCMLTDWCDIMLVENCVYLKFLESSSKFLKLADSRVSKGSIQSPTILHTKQDRLESEKTGASAENQTESKGDTNASTASSTGGASQPNSNSSFVLIITNEQRIPFVSLQFLFHSNISYLDRVRLLEKFKEKLRDLNMKNFQQNTSNSPNSVISNLSSLSSFSCASPNSFSSPNLKQTNMIIDENQVSRYISVEYLNEYCHLLHKPDLYDAFKFILFDEIHNEHDLQENNSKKNQSSKLINFMHQKRFKWLINKNFSNQTAQNLKETIIDTFVRIRLKEGFKCLFQHSKFVVFTLQLSMFDSGEISTERTKQNEAKSSQANFKNGSSQICTFIYVIRFENTSSSESVPKKVGLLNIATSSGNDQANQEDSKSNEIFFSTEIYVEAIDGIYQDRARKSVNKQDKEKNFWDYFRNLNNLEILNLIYLQDLKCFSILQSSYALFLSKTNEVNNLSSFLSKLEQNIQNQQVQCSNSSIKDILTSIINFNQNYYDCIRLLPDMSLILSKHTLKETKNMGANKLRMPNSQYLFNRVNYNNKHTTNQPLVSNQQLSSEESDAQQTQQQQQSKKKGISLCEQLRPVLDCIDITRFFINSIDFDFTLKGILFESALYVCVYEDIPLNLFNNNAANKNLNKQELNCILKLQSNFFNIIDDNIKKMEIYKDSKVINGMKNEVKNALLLKLNDVKSGDSVLKRISENLKSETDPDNFKVWNGFSIAQATAKPSMASPSGQVQSSSGYHNKSDSSQSSQNSRLRNNTSSNIQQVYDQVENNKFFVYGLFFLNDSSDELQSSNHSNRLVFYFFNCVPESIKSSLIHTQSNSYLIRKSLFSTQKLSTTDSFNSYRFYGSKNSKTTQNSDMKLSQKSLVNKKYFSLSDILKLHLSLTTNESFLNLLDTIEQNCAKSYIRSVIHYLATYSLEQKQEEKEEANFEKASINRLLRLGEKIKLNEIGLTDYFKIICKHLTIFNDWEKCNNVRVSYLEKKFDEIFVKRFNFLPGFSDLFVFTSSDNDLEKEVIRESVNEEVLNDMDENENDYFNNYQDEDNENESSGEDASDSYDSESLDENETNYELDLNQAYYESDTNETQTQATTQTSYLSISETVTQTPRSRSKQKKAKKSLKSSSPFKNLNFLPKIKNSISGESSHNEQIIGIELVCEVSTETSPGLHADSLHDSHHHSHHSHHQSHYSRTRTNTLTPDNIDYLQTINENILIQQQQQSSESVSTLPPNPNPTNSGNKNVQFYSKFSKFNFSCLLDLIESRDLEDFKSLMEKIGLMPSDKFSTEDLKGTLSSVKVYLRFNWYSFNDLNQNNNAMNFFSINANPAPPQLKKQMSHTGIVGSSLLSSHLSSSSNMFTANLQTYSTRKKSIAKFEYSHLLDPCLKEFKWHLKDEILHSQPMTKIKSRKLFELYRNHIQHGVAHKFKNCHLEKKKIILSKITETTTISTVDAPTKSIPGKLTMSATKKTTTTQIDEDKSILTVDLVKFFNEFNSLLKTLDSKFYNCTLQQINENYYYLNCAMSDEKNAEKLTFKILITLKTKTIEINQNKSNKTSVSPSSLTNQGEMLASPKMASNIESNKTHGNRLIGQKQSNQSMNDMSSFKQQQQQQQQQQPIGKSTQVLQKTTINQIKIRTYFSFNHSSFDQANLDQESLIDHIILEFKKEIENLIKLSYLKLTLKDIDETRKWNNLLYLNDLTNEPALDTSLDLDETYSSKNLNIKTDSDSVNTIKNQQGQTSLVCNCVWSVLFKLHRLHQTFTKVHDVTPSSSFTEKSSATPGAQNQHIISQGLNKLREYLHNFKIFESTCGDLYIYTRNKEIYLLKLEEIYETSNNVQQHQNQSVMTQSSITNISSGTNLLDAHSVQVNENFLESLPNNLAKMQQQQSKIISRRPSFASIHDSNANEQILTSSQRILIYSGKTQNPSGGTVLGATALQANLATTNLNASSAQQRPPDYIRLSVYGLQEPDEEMKQELCKTLQAELDYWVLNRMCNSIEINTYKTTSQQHPDKLTDEDLTFFKQICDNYFDFEVPLPFVFNFNRTMRENFFYFVKQVFNNNFKAIEAPYLPHPYQITQLHQQSSKKATNENEENLENSKSNLKQTISNITSTTTQPISQQFSTQQLSFSFISMEPVLGPFDLNKSKNITTEDPYTLLLTRILFHNSKTKRIGKHNVSLILVEALYAIKGLDFLISSKVTRSNSIGANSSIPQTKKMSQNQILETSYTKCRETGPTFVFRFYCRGENNEINFYKSSLKSALNDALLYFLSEYFTRIEPELYLKKINLKKKPPTFRVLDLPEQSAAVKFRKRHKSTGTTEVFNLSQNLGKEFLKLNKSARETKLGRLLLSQKIIDEDQLNSFIISNFSQNLFDHRDYEDTIEYFRETIKAFDSNKILNNLILNPDKIRLRQTYFFALSCTENSSESSSENEDSSPNASISSSLSLHSLPQKPHRSMSMDPEMDRIDKNVLKEKLKGGIEKSHLRVIYDWLKGLYFIHHRSSLNASTRSASSISSLTSTSNLPHRIQSIASQPVLNQQPPQSPVINPSNAATSPSSTQISSYILRKQFNYRTKYNLTSLIRDFESNLRDTCKCDFNVNYYSFKNLNDNVRESGQHHLDSVFFENLDLDSRRNSDKPASECEFNTGLGGCQQFDENDFGNDFSNLKQEKFSNLQYCLSKSENLIITMNAEYASNSMSSSMYFSAAMTSGQNTANSNSTNTVYSRVPSFGNESSSGSNQSQGTLITTGSSGVSASSSQASTATTINQTNPSSSNTNNIMMKSISSAIVDFDSSSNSLALAASLLKRTYCYAIVNAKTKTIIFYYFTTESTNYDSIKNWLDQTADLITQRYHLVNNTVLYKFGGLIGDNVIQDLKKVKQLTLSATHQHTANQLHNLTEMQSSSQTDLQSSQETKTAAFKQQSSQLSAIKLSKSPTLHRQLSYTKSTSNQINPSLITNLQFNNSSTQASQVASTTASPVVNQLNPTLAIKQLTINQYNIRTYDSISSIINQQVNFCSQYLTTAPSIPPAELSSLVSPNNLKSNNSSQAISNMSTVNTPQIPQNRSNTSPVNLVNSFYGVGLCYQLYEMQQVYRHPRKIYEMAISLYSSANTSPNNQTNSSAKPQSTNSGLKPSTTGNLISPGNTQYQNKSNLSDFYKNSIQPVLIPFHYCCTPLLFYSNWNESITNEKMLKLQSQNTKPKPELNKQLNSNDSWYSRMRQIVLVEYTKYFESHGFTRLKDERSVPQESTIKTSLNNKNTAAPQTETNQILHFIKWIPHDGFLYLTMNLEEIYLHVRIGYCSRYRSANRLGFINEVIRFLTQEFHVHSFIYDFHLSAINSNFLSSSQTGMQISQTSYIISKFLDEFVEFFSRVPLYSQNKVFKLIYEKSDNSLRPNQFTQIFDLINPAKKKLTSDKSTISAFNTLYIFDNNIAIYSLVDQPKQGSNLSTDCSKYLIVKIETYSKETSSCSPFSSTNKRLSKILLKPPSEVSRQTSLSKLPNSASTSNSSLATNDPKQTSNLKSKLEVFNRMTCFYLFINKSQQSSGSFASSHLMTSLNNDLEFINKVIDESINMYKQDIFWENLNLCMSSLKNLILGESMLGFTVDSQELKQILAISHNINILDLDPSLDQFLAHCYLVKEKIKNYFRFAFGRHFIYTESESIEYCILLLNDELIKNFSPKEDSMGSTTTKASVSSDYDSQLRSFILLKFDKTIDTALLLQINRVKMSKKENFSSSVGQKRPTLSEMEPQLASSVKSEHGMQSSSYHSSNSQLMNKTYKHLSFTVNTLMYVLWESLFIPS